MPDHETDDLLDLFTSHVHRGRTPDETRKAMIRSGLPETAVRKAQAEFEARTGRIRTLRDPPGLTDNASLSRPWYAGPSPGDVYWPALEQYLQARGWKEDLTSLDASSTRVVSLLAPPGEERIATRGLVLGYVQSGKTANFTAVVSKAADAGYRLFIVLSGLHNGLRSQTQKRLSKELVDLNTSKWITLTSVMNDFVIPASRADAYLVDNANHKILCVVKKNATVLRRLLKWLKAASDAVLSNCPTLIIDDEADQASVNAGGLDEAKRTAINRLIRDVLGRLPKVAYVGYTATPFANVLIDPDPGDLYPRDFIVSLPRPPKYFGPERIFGRDRLHHDDTDQEVEGLDMIRHVPAKDDPATGIHSEVELLKPRASEHADFEPVLTPSLRTAMRYFWMATAARRARGQGDQHSSMLIHTTLYTHVHERFKRPLEAECAAARKSIGAGDEATIAEWRREWDHEIVRVSASSVGETPTSFDELRVYLGDVLAANTVVVENSKSEMRLDYEQGPAVLMVVGGNTLARGLTLEGLVVSFFIRAASAYDTLLQMGRWFGYRVGYSDLPRIWVTPELDEYYWELATVEQEIRNDIQRYQDEQLTPTQFGVRIRTHPDLEITARLKMQRAITCDLSFSGQTAQTILFRHRDAAWLSGNMEATRTLLAAIRAADVKPEQDGSWRRCYRGVDADLVLSFLKRYQFHSDNHELRADLLSNYIQQEMRSGDLNSWNVGLVGRVSPDDGEVEIDGRTRVALVSRSRLNVGEERDDRVSIGALMSKEDIGFDLGHTRAELSRMSSAKLKQLRTQLPGAGLLLLYVISKDSRPALPANRRRAPLGAIDHMIGVGFVFPQSRRPEQSVQKYVTVDLSGVERETLAPIEDDEPEEATT